MDNDISLSPLKDLHELLGDATKGYADAASKMKTPKIAAFLDQLSAERAGMQRELAVNIHRMCPSFENLDNGTLKGDLHRAWMNIREALASSEEGAILDECARGEGYLLDRFTSVLEDKDMPAQVQRLLREQKTRVDVTLSTIEQLRETVDADLKKNAEDS